MSDPVKKVVLLSASPKPPQEYIVSEFLARYAGERLHSTEIEAQIFQVRQTLLHKETQPAYEAMFQSDAVLLFFPLYFFCMPAMLTRFLQDFAAYADGKERCGAKLYVFVNCGFPEPEINLEAVRAAESFAKHSGFTFRFGVMIGGGGMLLGAKDAPFMKEVFSALDRSLSQIEHETLTDETLPAQTVSIPVKFPRRLYFFGGNLGWKSTARKNGLKRKDLYRKPYLKG